MLKSTRKARARPIGSGWLFVIPCLLVAGRVSTGGAGSHWAASDDQVEAARISRIEYDLRVIDERGADTSQRHSIAEHSLRPAVASSS